MNKTCIGCGSILQSDDESALGYTPLITNDYCKRCFRLIHYNDNNFINPTIDPYEIIKKINNQKGICFFLCDILNFSEEAFNYYQKIKLPKTFIVSKSDIIPKSISFTKIKNWLITEKNIKENIIFASSKNNIGLVKLEKLIKETNEKIFFTGMTNVGKSSLLNKLYNNNILTISNKENTTLDFVLLPNTTNVYDTAGFPYPFSITIPTIKKTLNPITMPLKANAGLLIDKIGRIICDTNNSITCFTPYKVNKVYSNNPLYLEEKPILLTIPKESHLLIKGQALFYIKESCHLKIYHIKKDQISISKSFMKGKYNG